jgi:2-amino-4-hydroxy-6-hydroxymethyldihydropteridine diphosphokinase
VNAALRITASAGDEAVYLGLGSNQGDRLSNLRQALFALATHPEIRVTAVSSLYETEYVGPGRQAAYLNACVEIDTSLAPEVLLAVLQATETRLGRLPESHLQPRPIDLDILLHGQRVQHTRDLTLPHSGLRHRAFVLEPLREIAADLVIPDSNETVQAACERIRRSGGPWVRLQLEETLLPAPLLREEEDWRAALAVHCR